MVRHFEDKPLRVLCWSHGEKDYLISTREDYMPSRADFVSAEHDPLPPSDPLPPPAFNKQGYEYHAYLPRDRQAAFNYNIFECLHHTRHTQRDGRYYLAEATRQSWETLEKNLSLSIHHVARGSYVSLGDSAPPLANRYGYTRGHATIKKLNYGLKLSRHAFLLRLAYFTYLYSIQQDDWVPGQTTWIDELRVCTHYGWMDTVSDAVKQQAASCNFIGTITRPDKSTVRWLRHASLHGVPIWVAWVKGSDDYRGVDGDHIIKQWWCPTSEQVAAAKAPPIPSPTDPDLVMVSTNTPPLSTDAAHLPTILSLPIPALPHGSKFIPDIDAFFQSRDEADKQAEITATFLEKQQWEGRRQAAKSYLQPGRQGAQVYIWTEANSGGYIREQITRRQIDDEWVDYRRRHMIFHARTNTWDLCRFWGNKSSEEVKRLDELDDAEEELDDVEEFDVKEFEAAMDQPLVSAPPPGEDSSDLTFIYRRYGYLTIEPDSTSDVVLKLGRNGRKVVGLTGEGPDDGLHYLNHFISSILKRQLPDVHCDLSSQAPENEAFSTSTWGVVDQISKVMLPELGDAMYMFIPPHDNQSTTNLLIHDPLTVVELGRMKVQPDLPTIVDHLLRSGSQFTLLSQQTEHLESINLLTFPIRPERWTADTIDYQRYTSMLRTFLMDRPYVAAAALARGGIVWRIVREVLGLDIDLVLHGTVFTAKSMAVEVSGSNWWCHRVSEDEWFFLVGGYDIYTGL